MKSLRKYVNDSIFCIRAKKWVGSRYSLTYREVKKVGDIFYGGKEGGAGENSKVFLYEKYEWIKEKESHFHTKEM